ncbi:MAG: hypothetical protein ACLFSQ_08035 [Candidatus Zixiibacteriota bacterium]
MKTTGILFSLLIAITIFAQTPLTRTPLDGDHNLTIEIYDSSSGGELLWTNNYGRVHFTGGNPDIDIESTVRDMDLGHEIVYAQLIIDGERLSSDRIAINTGSSLRREAEPMDEMDMGLIIGETGNDIAVRSDRMVVGAGDPNEKVTVEGSVSLEEQTSAPSFSDGFGKIFVDETDGHLYYIDETGDITDLTVDGNAVQSVSSSANVTGRVDHMRFIPGEATEITESATDDTIYIRYDVNVTSEGSDPCTSAPPAPTFIDGNSLACSGEPGTSYSTLPIEDATYYRWTLPFGSSILTGSGTNSIRVMFGNTDGDICVSALNSCGESASSCMAVTINRPTSPGSITGPTLVCQSETGVSYNIATVPDATNYSWTVPPGASIVSGSSTPTITVNYATSPGEICVRTENSCGISDPECITVNMTWTPSTPGTITGTSDVCPGETSVTYSISEVAEATDYTWTVPSGASISSGDGTTSIDVDFSSSGGDVCVQASNSCGTSSARCFTVNMMAAPTIASDPSSVSVDEDDAASFSVSASGDGLTYQWQQSTDGGSGWSNVGSATNSYSIGSTTASMDGYQYRCIVSGTCSPADTSSAATLTVSSGLYDFVSHTFTNCGASGRTGPTLTQCRSSYSTSWDDTYLSMGSQGIQLWTVPRTGTYRIEAWGAEGGGTRGGLGARMRGDFDLTEGDVLKILVGQSGGGSGYNYTGGGGGSFVTTSSDGPLIIAGGGAGAATTTTRDQHGRTETSGGTTYCYTYCGTPGTGGSGGGNDGYSYLGGGGGLSGSGASGSNASGGQAFVSGGVGGDGGHFGGFGGGGSSDATGWDRAGGGGGYSGGGSALHDDTGYLAAGGGGSYNDGTNQSNTAGVQSGHGQVTVTFCPTGDCGS